MNRFSLVCAVSIIAILASTSAYAVFTNVYQIETFCGLTPTWNDGCGWTGPGTNIRSFIPWLDVSGTGDTVRITILGDMTSPYQNYSRISLCERDQLNVTCVPGTNISVTFNGGQRNVTIDSSNMTVVSDSLSYSWIAVDHMLSFDQSTEGSDCIGRILGSCTFSPVIGYYGCPVDSADISTDTNCTAPIGGSDRILVYKVELDTVAPPPVTPNQSIVFSIYDWCGSAAPTWDDGCGWAGAGGVFRVPLDPTYIKVAGNLTIQLVILGDTTPPYNSYSRISLCERNTSIGTSDACIEGTNITVKFNGGENITIDSANMTIASDFFNYSWVNVSHLVQAEQTNESGSDCVGTIRNCLFQSVTMNYACSPDVTVPCSIPWGANVRSLVFSIYHNASVEGGNVTPPMGSNATGPQFYNQVDDSSMFFPQVGDNITMNISVYDNASLNISTCIWYMNDTMSYQPKATLYINSNADRTQHFYENADSSTLPANAKDGDYGTYYSISTTTTHYVNYTRTLNLTAQSINVSTTAGNVTINVPSQCDREQLQLRYRFTFSGFGPSCYLDCYDGSTYQQLYTVGLTCSYFYEEAATFVNLTVPLSYTYQIQNYSTAAKSRIGWYVWCNNSESMANMSDTKIFKVKDLVYPYIYLASGNGFSDDNTTIISGYVRPMQLKIGFFDNNLFQFLVNITCDVSGQIFYHEELDLNQSTYVYEHNVSLTSYPPQKCYVYASSSDDHTKKKVGDYTEAKVTDGVVFTTDTNAKIKIVSESGKNKVKDVKSKKKEDRYSFTFDFKDKKKTREFTVTSLSGTKIYSREGIVTDNKGKKNKVYYGHLVMWDDATKTGTWIDFNEKDMDGSKTYDLKRNSDTSYTVTITSSSDIENIVFESIGGTNVQNMTWEFYIGSVINVTGVNTYDGLLFSNFNVNMTALTSNPPVQNRTWHASSTSINLENLSVGTYRLDFTDPAGRYYNSSNHIVVVTGNNYSINFSSHQATANFALQNVKDLVWLVGVNITITNIATNQTTSAYNNVTNLTTMYINAGNYTYYMTSPLVLPISGNFTIQYLQNKTVVAISNISSTFHLLDEKTRGPFNVSATQRVLFQLFCPTETIVTEVNSSNPVLNIGCAYIKFRFVVEYPTTNYYRTFIFQPEDLYNVNIYLIDFATTQSVQVSFILDDLFNTYDTPSIYVYKLIQGNNNTQIHADYADIENKVTAFLIQYDEYMVEIHSSNNPDLILGKFIATVSGNKILKLYTISPQEAVTTYYAGVSYATGLNNYTGTPVVFLSYYDTLNGTIQVLWEVRRDTADGPAINTLSTASNDFYAVHNVTDYLNHSLYSYIRISHAAGSTHEYETQVNDMNLTSPSLPFINDIGALNFEWMLIILIAIIALYATIQTATPLAFLIGVVAIVLIQWEWIGFAAGIGSKISISAIAAALLFVTITWAREHERNV